MVTESIKPGYKQTEIGIIPGDWDVKEINDVARVVGGGTPSTNNSKFWNGIINWFTPTEVGATKYLFESERKITEDGLQHSSANILPEGTILLTSRAGIGDLGILKTKASTNQGFQSLVPENIDGEYLYYFISLNKNILLNYASGSTFLEISPRQVKKIKIFFPKSKEEQSAIAQALSKTDELIEHLDKLIKKKKDIKKGAMQELLTGKKRLPGFEGEWVDKELGNIFTLTAGQTKSKFIQETGNYVIMDMGSVSTEGKNISSKYTNYDKDMLQEGDLVMPKDDIGGGFIIGRTAHIDENNRYILGDHVYRLRKKDKQSCPVFYSYLINSHEINSSFRSKAAGSAQIGLNRKSIEEQEVKVPIDIKEQQAIAQVLSDMDEDIDKLESELNKYKMIKEGMMQQLLTGKVRLTWK